MNFIRFILFSIILIFSVSSDTYKNKSTINFLGPVLEVVNKDGRLNYTGRVINNSDKKISNALIRYVARNQDGKIIEAITVPLVGKNGLEIIKGEVINFEFTLRIETKNVYDKQLTLDYLQ